MSLLLMIIDSIRKLTALETKDKIRAKQGIPMFDDLPRVIKKQHTKLYPVLQVLRTVKENQGQDSNTMRSVHLKNGCLHLNEKSYTKEETEGSPSSLGPLSNHYICDFEVKGKVSASMEKYLMIEKTRLFSEMVESKDF